MTGQLSALPSERLGRQCQAVLARHGKTFRLASLFLPADMRRDASIVYALCRHIDNVVDEAEHPTLARRQLELIRDMLRGRIEPSELLAAFCETARRRGFGLEPVLALLEGVESDLEQVRLESDGELLTYCYRVAGTVGLMMCGVLGVTDQTAGAHAVQLGVAMQLTNICRDVREDAALGRVYLPKQRLLAVGLQPSELEPDVVLTASPLQQSAISIAVLELLAEAERLYAQAAQGYRHIPPRPRLAIVVAAQLYRAIGRRLARRGGDPLAGRTVVPGWLKMAVIARSTASWLQGLLPPEREGLLLGMQRTHGETPFSGPFRADAPKS